jgi:hypothetical protein
MTHRRSDRKAGPDTTGPALTGTPNEILVQALRNLWPILSKTSRAQAIKIVEEI